METQGQFSVAINRLVTDGMAESFLTHGRATGEEQPAQFEATSILAEPPLHNPQWRFVQIDVEGSGGGGFACAVAVAGCT